MILKFFRSKFYDAAVVPDTEVKLEIPESKIRKITDPEPEIDDLALYNKYKLDFWFCCWNNSLINSEYYWKNTPIN